VPRLRTLLYSVADGLDLDARTLEIGDTLISVGGAAMESDGKSEAGCRTVSLDDFTVSACVGTWRCSTTSARPSVPRTPTQVGSSYGRTVAGHIRTQSPDKFNRLVDAAGARRIRLHDIRHTLVTLARDAGIDGRSSATGSGMRTRV